MPASKDSWRPGLLGGIPLRILKRLKSSTLRQSLLPKPPSDELPTGVTERWRLTMCLRHGNYSAALSRSIQWMAGPWYIESPHSTDLRIFCAFALRDIRLG